jgi:surface carbohydrate biosynthesis protein (TIGR04326 family)
MRPYAFLLSLSTSGNPPVVLKTFIGISRQPLIFKVMRDKLCVLFFLSIYRIALKWKNCVIGKSMSCLVFKVESSGGWIFWEKDNKSGVYSLDSYVENHAHRLKEKYLSFITDVSEARLGKKRLSERFQLKNGYNLWWMSLLAEKSPYKSPAIADCIKFFAVEEILKQSKASKVLVAGADKAVIETFRILCKQSGIELSFDERASTRSTRLSSLQSFYRKLPHSLRGFLFLGRYLSTVWITRRHPRPVWSAPPGSLFIFSYFIHLDLAKSRSGIFYSRQWEVLPELFRSYQIKVNWLHHYLNSDAAGTPQQAVDLVSRFNMAAETNGKHALINGYSDIFLWMKVVRNFIHILLVAPSARKAFSVKESSLSLWPMLKDDWLSSVKGTTLVQNLLWIFQMDKAMKEIPKQSCGLYLLENQGWERALIHAWKRHGHGTLIGVQHSSVRYWDLRHHDTPRVLHATGIWSQPQPHHIAVNGPAPLAFFLEAGYKKEIFINVEAVRYLKHASTSGNKRVRSDGGSPKVILLGDILLESTLTLLRTLLQLTHAKDYSWTAKITSRCHHKY